MTDHPDSRTAEQTYKHAEQGPVGDDVSPAEFGYTLGLLAGEGSFFITFTRDDRYDHGLWYGPKVSVTMGEYTEAMLEDQQARYGLGTVNEHSDGYAWILSSRSDCHELRRLIDDYLEQHEEMSFIHAPKHRAYRRWCDALELLQPNQSLSESEVVELAELRDEINYIRASSHIETKEIKEILGRE